MCAFKYFVNVINLLDELCTQNNIWTLLGLKTKQPNQLMASFGRGEKNQLPMACVGKW